MDTTNENMLQVNTFSNGMDTDTSDMLISDKSYRLAKNLRYITDVDETTGELRLIEGATSIDLISYNTDETIDGEGQEDFDKGSLRILAFNSVRNIGAIIFRDSSDNSWAVYRIEHKNGELKVYKIFGWCTTPIGTETKISTVLKWEADEKLQLYIADGEHPLMKINMYDDTHSLDIKYISSQIQHVDLNKIAIDSVLNGGSLQSGLIQYCYRLYNKNNISTQLAPLSEVKAIVNNSSSTRAGGLQNQEVSSMGLRIKVGISNNISNLYPKIQVYRIQYLVNGQLPKVSLVFDNYYDKDGNNFYFDDLGQNSLQELTVEEFNSMQGIEIIPKVIESKNNILFAGNIQYSPDILDQEYLNMDFRAFSAGDGVTYGRWPDQNANKINDNLDLSKTYDRNKWLDIANNNNVGGSGKNIRWQFMSMDADNRYELNSFPEDRYYTDINELKTNNKHISERSLAHDEIYRYGIILYSKSGTKYPVKWIADIRTPNIDYSKTNNNLKFDSILSYIDEEKEYANVLGVLFEINSGVLDQNKISGYEIVRARRTVDDRATISQGIITSTIKVKDNEFCVSGLPFLDHMYFVSNFISGATTEKDLTDCPIQTSTSVLQFYSPELLYQQDDIIQLLKNNKNYYLQTICPLYSRLNNNIKDAADFKIPENVYNIYKVRYGDYPITQDNVYFTHSAYFDSFVQYKLNYAIYKSGSSIQHKRIKWFDYRYPSNNFSQQGSNHSREDQLNYLNGLNVYKLYPLEMPKTIIDEYRFPIVKKQENQTKLKYDILDFAQIKEIDPDKLITEQSFNGKDYQSSVGNYTIYHCTAPYILSDPENNFTVNSLNGDANAFADELISTTDPSLALCLDRENSNGDIISFYAKDNNFYSGTATTPEKSRGDDNYMFEYSMLCNIRKNIVPYGGFSKYARNGTTYVQHGNYNSSNRSAIEVFDGDVAISTFECVLAHKWYAANKRTIRNTVVCQVAVESVMDTSLDCGDRFSNSTSQNASLVQVNSCNFNNEYIQKKPAYVYNTAYSIDPQLLLYNQNVQDVKDSINTFDYRVHYSNQAEPNQASDPWLKFQPLNYLDVDSRYGGITELRTFKNTLLFWQQKAVGMLSVNERVQITDNSNLPLVLGTGGVLDRYDYLSTTNGMKENQHADVQSDSALYWWDYDNHMICQYAGGNSIIPLSKAKSVQNFLNKRAKSNQLINTDLNDGQWPLLIHDNKYNEILFKVSTDSLVYSEQQQRFTSVYDIDPHAYLDFNSELILLHKHFNVDLGKNVIDAYKWNQSDGETSVGFNETKLIPYLKYVVNNMRDKVKVYDNVEFAGTIPGSFDKEEDGEFKQHLSKEIHFEFKTPLNQQGKINGELMTNRQLDFKFAVPRCGYEDPQTSEWVTKQWGDRMRGKTMQCEMSSDLNSLPFSLQYIFTKYRISWS